MGIKTLQELNPENCQVILRCDLNVPLKNGVIGDAGRLHASLSTIRKLLAAKCSIVIIAHLGRPTGESNPELSLAPIAKRLGELLNRKVIFSAKILGVGPEVNLLKAGEIMMLENIRFLPAETSKNASDREELAAQLSAYGQVYVGDGFGAVHRKHASVYELARLLPHAAGDLISEEVSMLEQLTKNPERPYGVVLGGAKVSDKIGVISNFLDKADLIAIGGGMVFTFLAAQGKEIGKSLVEVGLIDTVKELLIRAEKNGVKILLPTDIIVAPEFAEDSTPTIVDADKIPVSQMGLDIGPQSANNFAAEIKSCKTVFWNGPMGVFEFPNFSSGTRTIAHALTQIDGMAVVGGGDSAAAVRKLGFQDSEFGYISTGGGASLEYLEGKDLPGLTALQ